MGRKVLGLEVSPKAIRLAVVKNGMHPELLSCGVFPTSAQSAGDTLSLEDDNAITSIALTIKEIMAKNKRLSRSVDGAALCVSDSQTVVRPITLPPLPDAELDAAVEYELSQSFPGIAKTHAISFKAYVKNKKEVRGIASFSPRKTLEPFRRLLEDLDYKHSYIDVAANSQAKAYAFFAGGTKTDKTVLLCHMERKSTQFTIARRGLVLHSRQISEGVRPVQDLLPAMAGARASEGGPLSPDALPGGGIPPAELPPIFRTVYGNILEQLAETVEFFAGTGAPSPVAEVWLIGSGSFFPDLDGFFTAALGLPAIIPSPPANIKADRSAFLECFSAIGAAVRGD